MKCVQQMEMMCLQYSEKILYSVQHIRSYIANRIVYVPGKTVKELTTDHH